MKKMALLGLFIASLSLTAQSTKLQYNLKKGDNYQIDISLKQDMAPIMKMDIGMSMTMKTTGNSGNSIDSEYRFTQMKMDMSAQGERVQFDSSKKDSELSAEEKKMKAELAPFLEAVVYQTIDKTGKIVSMKMVPELQGAGAMLGQNQFTNMVYPKEPVKVGSSWDYKQSLSGMNAKMKYTVTKITDSKVYADISGAMDGAADAKVSGKLIIDKASGMMSSMNMDMTMNAMGSSVGMNITMTSKKI